jgi:hypothetical protein
MINLMNNEAIEEIHQYVVDNLMKIDVLPGSCRYNYKCHMNSVHEAIEHNQDTLVMCFYIGDNQPIIHFINIKGDKFIDNTLGHWCTQYNFYYIKTIQKEDFFNIENIFTEYRKELKTKLSFFVKLLSDVEF